MKRKDFLRGLGMTGGSLLLPAGMIAKPDTVREVTDDCVLIPTETAGPFLLDLSENSTYFRQDLREDRQGVQLNVRMRIKGLNNCGAMPNLRVNIWHCDKDGLYSGYSANNNPGQAGLTYLRGYQFTDANGEVEFVTIFPGWYTGRICHIHFQVYVSSTYAAISQMTFDIPTKNAIYAANPTLYTKGADPMTLASDNIFSDGYAYQVASLTANTTTGGYDAFLEVTIQGEGTLGIGNLEKETAKQMSLGQNFPNPFTGETTIPFSLTHASAVRVILWDLSGRQVLTLDQGTLMPGDHAVTLDLAARGLAGSSFLYQVQVQNAQGTFSAHKMMTVLR
ncbi:MAG: hypothetical protein SF053_16730 [Bacteroidia bacterium]|nr:hypothetical protein [Bacteroidia bacterium]